MSSELSAKVEDVKEKSSDVKKEASGIVSSTTQQVSQRTSESINHVQEQLMSYGNQIQQLLSTVSANIEDYRFSFEKTDYGLKIDIAFKAAIRSKASTAPRTGASRGEISP